MNITVRNIKHQEIKRKELIEAIEWFSEKLMGKRLPPKLNIFVSFKEIEEHGLCSIDDCDPYPRYFTIEIKNGLEYKEILGSLAHELVHVKQFARRELTNFDVNERAKYLGKRYKTDDIDYWDLPWEVEAHGREVGLVVRYLEQKSDG
jgi:hypothetical protein